MLVGDCSFDFGYKTIMDLRERLSGIDGIFAETDLIAIGAIEALKELGIRIPGDMKIVGYDDIELGRYLRPRLSTIHQPWEEHAGMACERLIGMLNENDTGSPMQQVIKPLAVRRESC